MLSFIVGLVIVAAVVAVVYVHKHPGAAAPTALTPAAISSIVSTQLHAIPALIDARVQELEAALAEANARAEAAEKAKADDAAAHAALIAGVVDRVTLAVTTAPLAP